MKKIIVGIDFAKEKFDVAVLVTEGLDVLAPVEWGQFENSQKGYRLLVAWVKKTTKDKDTTGWLFCGENTGACHVGLSEWLTEKGCFIWIENAYSIKHSMGLVRGKTDKSDALMIARFAHKEQKRARGYQILSQEVRRLREVFMYRRQLVRERTAAITRLKDRKVAGIEKASSFVAKSSERHIKELAKEIALCDKELMRIIASDESLTRTFKILVSFNGIALQNAVALITYTDNFTRFDGNSRKLAAYYGVAPYPNQSGKTEHKASVSNFANKDLKSLLSQAALCAIRYCPAIAAYYNRLKEKGKNHWLALNNVKNKILHILSAMVRDGREYSNEIYAKNQGLRPDIGMAGTEC